jgi:Trypsin-like peptidase domain
MPREFPKIPHESAEPVAHDIFPIFFFEPGIRPMKPVAFAGTGFRLADLAITCWHCVEAGVAEGYEIAAAIEDTAGYGRAAALLDLAQDENGADLALARLSLAEPSRLNLELAGIAAAPGADVWAFGYPLTTRSLGESGDPAFRLQPRLLQGYVTRSFLFEHHGYGAVASYEVDMPVPEGLSGAPLVRYQTLASPTARTEVIGVVYGRADVGTIEEFARIDAETGERSPEVQRVVSFALAHYTATMIEARAPATLGNRLADYMAAWNASL